MFGIVLTRREAAIGFANQNGSLTVSNLIESRLQYRSTQHLHSSPTTSYHPCGILCILLCRFVYLYKAFI